MSPPEDAPCGRVLVVGLGPGAADLLTPRAAVAIEAAEVVLGYGPYLDRLPPRSGQRRLPSDNREELARARHALELAAGGAVVAVASSGDAGVFAMAAAVFEALEATPALAHVPVEVVPGVSAMLAAAARLGAPLGHDFCTLSLSDNLKPWALVLRRLRAAAEAGFVLALYNPVSRARPWQLDAALDLLREVLPPTVPVAFATAVSRPDERLHVVPLSEARAALADMRTLVLVGTAETRHVGEWIYTPRRSAAEP